MIEYIEKKQALKCLEKYSSDWLLINALPTCYLGDVEEMPPKITVTVTTDDGEVIADIDGDEIISKKGYKVIMRGEKNDCG